jgi:hypothetical protein
VVTTDPTAATRCFFDRPSAPDHLEEEAEEQAASWRMWRLKLAIDYMHPELPWSQRRWCIADMLPADRISEEEAEAHLGGCERLKKLAIDYMHPEMPVH